MRLNQFQLLGDVFSRLSLKGQQLVKASREWPKFSRLMVCGDNNRWVLSDICRELEDVCSALGVTVALEEYRQLAKYQAVFFTNKYVLMNRRYMQQAIRCKHRIGLAYFHGDPHLDRDNIHLIRKLNKYNSYISRIQVSHSRMEAVILDAGVDRDRIFRIPISFDPKLFKRVSTSEKSRIRRELNIPISATVVGSFQKDGIGWKKGDEPKLIKGPDIFLDVLSRLRGKIPGLYVLLTGPSRGFVKNGLNKLNIPYTHQIVSDYRLIGRYYNAIDAYIVTSREEGGPRAILESMASGIPLISTRVGQAIDLIQHESNGWLANVDDIDALAHYLYLTIDKQNNLGDVLDVAYQTAANNSYVALLPIWKRCLDGLVD